MGYIPNKCINPTAFQITFTKWLTGFTNNIPFGRNSIWRGTFLSIIYITISTLYQFAFSLSIPFVLMWIHILLFRSKNRTFLSCVCVMGGWVLSINSYTPFRPEMTIKLRDAYLYCSIRDERKLESEDYSKTRTNRSKSSERGSNDWHAKTDILILQMYIICPFISLMLCALHAAPYEIYETVTATAFSGRT